ncbi:MAG TPA: 2-amino-4-hydroxy-6-hydroxymethyldihydropteridine diphosphokinase [Actinomycetota bacterium]|nr:2-amino-4-hydroxy-6-hydroxymethyldihydropteridine diphosphokinase [Actinomycetota bacterium]
MVVSYLGIGSNVGDRVAFCRAAVGALRAHEAIEVEAASSLYETSPVGGPPQRSFVNLVVRIRTSLDARGLLETVKGIERQLGREPNEMRWGPRVVDLDVLTFDDEKIVEPDLEIPHPRLRQRRFVLVPLLEIDADAADPWGARYADSLDEAEGDVELLEPFEAR